MNIKSKEQNLIIVVPRNYRRSKDIFCVMRKVVILDNLYMLRFDNLCLLRFGNLCLLILDNVYMLRLDNLCLLKLQFIYVEIKQFMPFKIRQCILC